MTNDLSLNTSFNNGVQFAWDSTSIKLAETCPRKYQLVMLEGWRSKTKSAHLLFGGLFASAVERYHKLVASGTPTEKALIEIVHSALIDTWEHTFTEDGIRIAGTGQPQIFLHNSKTRENLIRTIIWYLEHWKNDTAQVVKLSNGVPAVEYSFSFEVSSNIIFSGHIDRLVELNNELYVMDQKTTGSTVGPYYFRPYDLDSQMSLYTMAGKIIYQAPIHGVLIDAAQIAVGFSRFERGFTHRTDDQLKEWLENTLELITEMQSISASGNAFRMNYSSCGNFGGCEFASVCSKSRQVRGQFLSADFEQRKWDPLERR